MSRKIYGRTLLELISTLAMLLVLISIALPNLRQQIENNERTQAVNQLLSLLHHTRSNAVYTRRVVTLCQGESRCSESTIWRGTLLIFVDHNANGQRDIGDELLYQTQIAEGLSWHWNRNKSHIQFEADGTTRALNGTFTLCKRGAPQRQVVIALSGRVRNQPPARGAYC
ncbi:GspH/FimT family pseudopilin [Ectopseudomonas hydrolytica]|uniref:Type II secretion system protein H n=1 Tax=Ectopseudomonas hydrolytica TaxID=2493633 RepID=A0ABY5AAD3_9GAMM|nr:MULTISPECIES: GspH/FimT family pseudopilin [Pseudomonas]ARS47791.1 hypothetical protein PSMEN_05085 [Pseudomonas mendocina]MDH0098364.1 GspH/FimT family pseudopilin [Pseudomonas sp. GD04158]USR40810.1 GspH/FimT family pseudopilin [Pseudomonas hydrolytica]